MIIRDIALNNLGPFLGVNELKIDYSNNKRILLIGGKNGAGKTTIFHAIRVALYGCKAYGYEVNNSHYYAKIQKLINNKVSLLSDASASVKISIEFNDGEHDGVYSIERKWLINSKIIREEVAYYKNNEMLDEENSYDFENLLLHIIPPTLFDFFFFDGERIDDLLQEDGSSFTFKDAFIKMCRLDNLDILINCFKKKSGQLLKDKSVLEKYKLAQSKYNKQLNSYNSTLESRDLVNKEIEDINNRIKELNNKFRKTGGCSPDEWKNLNSILAQEESERYVRRKQLRDFANDGLPFIILRKQLNELLDDIKRNDSYEIKNIAKLFIENKETVLDAYFGSHDSTVKLKKILFNDEQNEQRIKRDDYLRLSFFDKQLINLQILEKLKIDASYYVDLEQENKTSQKNTKKIKSKLSNLNFELFENYSKKLNLLNQNLKNKSDKLRTLEETLSTSRGELEILEKEYKFVRKILENNIKDVSVHDISARAYLALSNLSSDLYNKNIQKTIVKFKEVFDSIINKKNLIDGIYITENLCVYPYRNTFVRRDDIESMLNNIGEESTIDNIGELAYKKFTNNKAEYINLPMKINGTLSKGETQIYLMSLYFALTSLLENPIPFIVDTPLGRIDVNHKNKIIANFFLKLKGQLIILATDEEINKTNISLLKQHIGTAILLKNTDNGSSQIVSDQYCF